MLCRACHLNTDRQFPYCLHCGTAQRRRGGAGVPPLQLVLESDPSHPVPLVQEWTTLGRDPDTEVPVADAAASRHHARIHRGRLGYTIEDCGSANGTWVNGDRLTGPRLLNDGDTLRIGDTMLRTVQPRTAEVGGRTELQLAGTTRLLGTRVELGGQQQSISTGPLDQRPRRRSGWAIKRTAGGEDEPVHTLSNTRTGQYLRLGERDRFIWERIDGESTVRDLLFAYADEYGVLALARIQELIAQLRAAGLVALPGDRPAEPPRSRLRRGGRRVVQGLMRMEVSVSGIDGLVERIYRNGGWRIFTPAGLLLVAALVVGGIAGFVVTFGRVRLFDVGGIGALGVVVTLGGYMISLSIHELAHALATKSYGRRVSRGGMMIMLGMPFAFVDTSDMWFEGRKGPRIAVSLAGPLATAAMAGGLSIASALLPPGTAPAVCFHVAFGLYVNTLFNFNPLIPLDGYYVLMDVFGRPHLREEAVAFFRRRLWRDLLRGRLPRGGQWALAVYGMFCFVATFAFIGLAVVTWRKRLGPLVAEHVARPWDSVLLVGGFLVILFPIWFVPATKLARALSRRRSRRRETAAVAGTA